MECQYLHYFTTVRRCRRFKWRNGWVESFKLRVIAWTNVVPVHWYIYASLDLNELTPFYSLIILDFWQIARSFRNKLIWQMCACAEATLTKHPCRLLAWLLVIDDFKVLGTLKDLSLISPIITHQGDILPLWTIVRFGRNFKVLWPSP